MKSITPKKSKRPSVARTDRLMKPLGSASKSHCAACSENNTCTTIPFSYHHHRNRVSMREVLSRPPMKYDKSRKSKENTPEVKGINPIKSKKNDIQIKVSTSNSDANSNLEEVDIDNDSDDDKIFENVFSSLDKDFDKGSEIFHNSVPDNRHTIEPSLNKFFDMFNRKDIENDEDKENFVNNFRRMTEYFEHEIDPLNFSPFRQVIREKDKKMEFVQQEMERLDEEATKLNEEKNEFQEKNRQLKEVEYDNVNLRIELKNLRNDYDEMEINYRNSLAQMKLLERKIDFEAEYQDLSRDHKELKVHLEKLRRSNEDLECEKNMYEEKSKIFYKMKYDNLQLVAKNETMDNEIEKLKEDLKEEKKTNFLLKHEIKSLNKEKCQLEDQLVEDQMKLVDLDCSITIEDSINVNKTIVHQISQKKSLYTEFLEDEMKLRKNCEIKLKDNVKDKEEVIDILNQENDFIRNKYENIINRNRKNEENWKKVQEEKELIEIELDGIRREKEMLKEENESLTKENVRLEENSQHLKLEVNNIEESINTINLLIDGKKRLFEESLKITEIRLKEEYEVKLQTISNELSIVKDNYRSKSDELDVEKINNQKKIEKMNYDSSLKLKENETMSEVTQIKLLQLEEEHNSKTIELKEIQSNLEYELNELKLTNEKDLKRYLGEIEEIKIFEKKNMEEMKLNSEQKIKVLEKEKEETEKILKELESKNISKMMELEIIKDNDMKNLEELRLNTEVKMNELKNIQENSELALKELKIEYDEKMKEMETLKEDHRKVLNEKEKEKIEMINQFQNNCSSKEKNKELQLKLEESAKKIEDNEQFIIYLKAEIDKSFERNSQTQNEFTLFGEKYSKNIQMKNEKIEQLTNELKVLEKMEAVYKSKENNLFQKLSVKKEENELFQQNLTRIENEIRLKNINENCLMKRIEEISKEKEDLLLTQDKSLKIWIDTKRDFQRKIAIREKEKKDLHAKCQLMKETVRKQHCDQNILENQLAIAAKKLKKQEEELNQMKNSNQKLLAINSVNNLDNDLGYEKNHRNYDQFQHLKKDDVNSKMMSQLTDISSIRNPNRMTFYNSKSQSDLMYNEPDFFLTESITSTSNKQNLKQMKSDDDICNLFQNFNIKSNSDQNEKHTNGKDENFEAISREEISERNRRAARHLRSHYPIGASIQDSPNRKKTQKNR
ncbi:hypothetical protein SNEBB_009961 [Seison nebaliae]|nr:hypothetical protein SNEBB_009961 [Seison nebaliae]